MKKLIFIIGLFFCSSTNAEWVFFSESTIDGSIFWYEDERVRFKGDDLFVWVKTRYKKENQFGDRSSQVYYKINCEEYSYQILSQRYYTDYNWIQLSTSDSEPSKLSYIPPDSSIEILAYKVCNRYTL